MKAAISLKGRLEKDSYDQIKDISLKVPERICEKSGRSSLTADKDDKENKEIRERKIKRGRNKQKEIMQPKRTRLYLNKDIRYQKDDSVFMIILFLLASLFSLNRINERTN